MISLKIFCNCRSSNNLTVFRAKKSHVEVLRGSWFWRRWGGWDPWNFRSTSFSVCNWCSECYCKSVRIVCRRCRSHLSPSSSSSIKQPFFRVALLRVLCSSACTSASISPCSNLRACCWIAPSWTRVRLPVPNQWTNCKVWLHNPCITDRSLEGEGGEIDLGIAAHDIHVERAVHFHHVLAPAIPLNFVFLVCEVIVEVGQVEEALH